VRKIFANYIVPVSSAPLKNGIIIIDKDAKIVDIIDTKGEIKETAGLEYYNGILVPGFINTHCHIELSYLKGKIKGQNGVTGFVSDVARLRNKYSKDEILKRILKADMQMRSEGIVAVGDITNSRVSFQTKKESNIKYHSFIEVFGIDSNRANDIFERGKYLLKDAQKNRLFASLSPHSPYAISIELFQILKEYLRKHQGIISIHNQESESENMLFNDGKGKLADFLSIINKSYTLIKDNGSSLGSALPYLNPDSNILLVHNTFTSEKDVELAEKFSDNIFYALCPKSNLYIENKLPDISLFNQKGLKITVGTDSLASNNKLSIIEELKTISKHFPEIELKNLIRWGNN